MVTKYSCPGLDMRPVYGPRCQVLPAYNGLLTVLQNLFRSIQAEDWVEMLETSQQLTFLQLTGGCIKRRFKKQISFYSICLCEYEIYINKGNLIFCQDRQTWKIKWIKKLFAFIYVSERGLEGHGIVKKICTNIINLHRNLQHSATTTGAGKVAPWLVRIANIICVRSILMLVMLMAMVLAIGAVMTRLTV